MLSEKLLSLLKTFNRYELNRFRKYLISPFYNENQNLITLFDIIDKHFRKTAINKSIPLLQKKDIWKKIFGNNAYKDLIFRRLSSDLKKHAWDYLTITQLQKEKITDKIYLIKALNKTHLTQHFVRSIRKTRLIQSKSSVRNIDFHFTNFIIEQQAHLHLDTKSSKTNDLENLQKADLHLECYYVLNKLRHYCDLLMYKNVRAIKADLHFYEDFWNYIEDPRILDEPVIQIYHTVVLSYLEIVEEKHFYNLIKLLDEHYACLNRDELRWLYQTTINYCAAKLNTGKLEYYQELFKIYKSLIDKDLILVDGFLEPGNYKNIISVGLNQKEFKWVTDFIESYTDLLPKESQDNDRSYNMAKVYFWSGDYQKVVEQLREVEYKTPSFALGGKLMLLKTYYELKEENVLDSLIHSFSIFVRRNRLISKEVRQQYLNLIRFTKKLTMVNQYDKIAVQKLKTQIIKCKAVAAKNWLLEKVDNV